MPLLLPLATSLERALPLRLQLTTCVFRRTQVIVFPFLTSRAKVYKMAALLRVTLMLSGALAAAGCSRLCCACDEASPLIPVKELSRTAFRSLGRRYFSRPRMGVVLTQPKCILCTG